MGKLVIAIGSKENVVEDIHALAKRLISEPELLIVTGKDIRNAVIGQASNMFPDERRVLAIIDPERGCIEELKAQLDVLKEKIFIVLYSFDRESGLHQVIEGEQVVLEQDKEKRIREQVLSVVRSYGKTMTKEGFALLKERIKDESILGSELLKLVDYVGDRKEIGSKDVRAIVTETHEESFLRLFEAFAAFDRQKMIGIFENLLENGEDILAIQSYLVNQIRLLLQAKDMEEVFRAAGQGFPLFKKTFLKWKEGLDLDAAERKRYLPYKHPYYAFQLSQTSQKMSKRDLIAFLDMLAGFDVNVKRGTKYGRTHLEYGLLRK
ncbi:MAG: DNA polymerase III subunit delta [Syntrophorhabdus sp. PtaU1.Bin058]|nr:MAG: DNA polymerase III subunit delta [Syntrophorhabdus sp. PtaU1.Bin058]